MEETEEINLIPDVSGPQTCRLSAGSLTVFVTYWRGSPAYGPLHLPGCTMHSTCLRYPCRNKQKSAKPSGSDFLKLL